VKGIIRNQVRQQQQGVKVNLYGEITTISGEPVNHEKHLIDLITHRYLREKESLFHSLDGTYCLFIEDYSSAEVLLVRDKIGAIPIYYSLQPGIVCWGNRISDVLLQNESLPEINENVIHEYLVFRYVSSKNTIFKNIHEVLPGHYIKVNLDTGHVQEQAYWDIPYPQADKIFRLNEVVLVDQVEEILTKSIKTGFPQKNIHGVMLSGGVDSSLIVAIASKVYAEPLSTFFIGFKEYESDRSDDAREVSLLYDTKHSEFYLDAEQFATCLPEAIRINEEPLNHPGHVGRVLFNKHMNGRISCLHLGEV